MAEPQRYESASAFRRAFEDRLKTISIKERIPLERLRRQAAFDRLLARLFAAPNAPWALKGGYALELRLREARATRDIDLVLREPPVRWKGGNEEIRRALQDAANRGMGDFFEFQVGEPMMDLDAAPYGGARLPVTAMMDNRVFAKFHLDAAIGDPVIEPLSTTSGHDWLGFADIPAGSFLTISPEQHMAEKLHAYTLPRLTPNSRVRDLVDMELLRRSNVLDRGRVKEALRVVFARRKTHEPPEALTPPDAAPGTSQ